MATAILQQYPERHRDDTAHALPANNPELPGRGSDLVKKSLPTSTKTEGTVWYSQGLVTDPVLRY